MDIKKIIEEYDIIFDSMEDETGVNEVTDEKKEIKENLSDKKPNVDQAVYDEIKVQKPEVAKVNDTIAKKLFKQFEDLEIEIKVDGVNPEDVQVNVEGEEKEEPAEEPIEEGLLIDPDTQLDPGNLEVPLNHQRIMEEPPVDTTGDLLDGLLDKQKQDAEAREQDLKEQKIDEVSKEDAEAVNDQRQADVVKAELELKKAEEKAKKSNKLLKKWKKAKGIEESLNEEVVAKYDDGKHEIVRCKEGYYNRYNIKDGKARFTTKCVESLPTAISALKRRFPKAEEVK